MAGEDRNETAALIERLSTDPAAADFFQTVRLIGRAQARAGPQVGGDTRLESEPVRFHAAAGMRFAETEITGVANTEEAAPTDLTVAFMGLTGPSGVLPDHYSELVVERRRARDPGLNAFLDLFNHRAISLFYRAWAKYRLPVVFEEARGSLGDDFSLALASLAGLGLGRLRLGPAQAPLLAMAGPLSRRVRSASGLTRVVAALFDYPVEVRELQGRWMAIGPDDQTRLGSQGKPDGAFSALGVNSVVGATAYDVQSRFRLRFGPMGLGDFRSFFAADGPKAAILDAVRLTVGTAVDFDLQLVLRRQEAPFLRLGDPETPALLGQTTWLIHQTPERDLDDAVLGSAPAAAAGSEQAQAAP